ncbi:transposase [bacterium]|nr:transposase [bacterium]
MISRSRGYLPHLELSEGTYFVTFRLMDSLPSSVLTRLKQECFFKKGEQIPNVFLSKDKYHEKIEKLLDKGVGECWLRNPDIAKIVVNALKRFDDQQYNLHAWTVMPNHIHVLFTLESSSNLSSVVQGWKGATAFQANRMLERTGRFWQPEYFDVLVKTSRHFEFYLRYIFNNPVKAGLCAEVFHWPFTGCSVHLRYYFDRFFGRGLKSATPNAD